VSECWESHLLLACMVWYYGLPTSALVYLSNAVDPMVFI
jgi:hypothetical protein